MAVFFATLGSIFAALCLGAYVQSRAKYIDPEWDAIGVAVVVIWLAIIFAFSEP
jgi:hypothetical protein